MKNVLVFPCGTEIGMEVNRALADSKHFQLFGANSVDDHGRFVFQNYISNIPFWDSANFINELNKTVAQYEIDFIVPAHDSVVLKMAENQHNINATVVTSCATTCRVCRSKTKTYQTFNGLIPTPSIYNIKQIENFPVFLKPDAGQGAKGTHKANTKEEVEFLLKNDPTLIPLEYLPGREYTIDCFTDKNGALLFAEGRERIRIHSGISVNSRPVTDERFQYTADIINRTLSFQGVWFFQVKERADGELVLMEISPRIAGTMALFRADGVNFAQLSLFDRMGMEVNVMRNNLDIEIDRALFARFACSHEYTHVYIDFDDTIIVDGAVNTNIIKFIYQSRNLGKKVTLLSRHQKDLFESLRKFSICHSLFDKIFVLTDEERKSDFISDANCVFIDDSFSERKEVFDKLHIPVFSLDAVEALLLWRN